MTQDICPHCGLVYRIRWSEEDEAAHLDLERQLLEEENKRDDIKAQLEADWRDVDGEPMSEDDYYRWRGKAIQAFTYTTRNVRNLKVEAKRMRNLRNEAKLSTRFHDTMRRLGLDLRKLAEEPLEAKKSQ